MPNDGLTMMQALIGKSMRAESISPAGRWLDGVLRAITENSSEVEYTVREEMTNPVGTLHGGVIATMLDDAMGLLLNVASGAEGFYATVNLHLDYIGPARVGDVILASVQINRRGRQIANMEGWLRHAGGKPIAHATSNLLRIGA